ncbi:MAG: DNA adenine methylase [Candidatus Zixiibacteriota bacterium]
MKATLFEDIELKDETISPVLKWVGGKRQLLDDIVSHLPSSFSSYYEPFVGGGALLFHLQPKKAVINDYNEELINVYHVIKNYPKELIEDLRKHKNTTEYFYQIRALDRKKDYSKISSIQRASRILYLNKTCYNGLYRVNKSGEFNTPFGRYKNPNIVNQRTIEAVSCYFNKNDIRILNTDFEKALVDVDSKSFVYLDPPYDPVSNTANFTSYSDTGFDRDEQIRLKKFCDRLNKIGVKFLLSNSSTEFINDLYSEYNILLVKAKRAINSNAKRRGSIYEVLVKNY